MECLPVFGRFWLGIVLGEGEIKQSVAEVNQNVDV